MNYKETIDYLYSQLPMFSRIGSAAYKKDLHNTIELCRALDNPQNKFKSIHIAGTNGKGSTSHMLAAILQQAGYKTGLYTSPHLKDFRERIKINGDMIPEDAVTDFVQRIKETSEAIEPSFFEVTVAMAFDYFAKEQVDFAVIETGLGGRLDSTNIITPILSIITNIGYDHMNILGDTLEKIASEKAGIIKQNIPVIIGEYLPETKPVFERKAAIENAPMHFASEKYSVKNTNLQTHYLSCILKDTNETESAFTLDLSGIYQTNNLRTVLTATDILIQQGVKITEATIHHSLQRVKALTGLHGRWEAIAEHPTIVLDVAHNEDGIKQVLKQLALLKEQYDSLHIIIGMVKDKDINKALAQLPKDASYYFTHAHIPRALPAIELKEKATSYGLNGDAFDDVNKAIDVAKQKAGKHDLILVCGSVFLVGEVNRQAFN